MTPEPKCIVVQRHRRFCGCFPSPKCLCWFEKGRYRPWIFLRPPYSFKDLFARVCTYSGIGDILGTENFHRMSPAEGLGYFFWPYWAKYFGPMAWTKINAGTLSKKTNMLFICRLPLFASTFRSTFCSNLYHVRISFYPALFFFKRQGFTTVKTLKAS